MKKYVATFRMSYWKGRIRSVEQKWPFRAENDDLAYKLAEEKKHSVLQEIRGKGDGIGLSLDSLLEASDRKANF